MMLRSLAALWSVNPGFDPRHVLAFEITPSPQALSSPSRIRQTFVEFPERLESVPGIQAAAADAGSLPMRGASDISFWLEGQTPPTNLSDADMALLYAVTPNYWKTMGIPLVRGRFLTSQDNQNSRPVAVIDETLADKFFGHQDPLGKQINVGILGTGKEIVGVVGHVQYSGLAADRSAPTQPQFYMPLAQIPDKFMPLVASGSVDFVVRTAGSPGTFISAVRTASQQFDSNQVVYNFEPMDQIVSDTISTQNLAAILLGAFAALALLLACIGIYGVTSYLVSQRIHEIGIRAALGAQRMNVLWLIVGKGLKLTRFLMSLLYGVKANDLVTFAAVAVVLVGVALFGCYVPARRAMRVDPMVALRYE
jgi:predicted permease